MSRVKILAVAGATLLASATAFAADFPPAMPPMQPTIVPPPPVVESSGWYLRGDVGVGYQSFSEFEHTSTNSSFVWPASWEINQKEIGDAAFVGFGIGHAWNSWLRFDVTAEYRTKAKFKAIGSYSEFCPLGGRCFDVYDGFHSSSVFLANAYLDLGTWWCLQPFVGIGAGGAYHRIAAIHDEGFLDNGATGFGYADSDKTSFTFAWAAHAGIAYNYSDKIKFEFAYRYLNMGSPESAVIGCAASGCATTGARAFYTLSDLQSHDFKIGIRWMLQPEQVTPAYAPAPVYAPPPAPVYAPPPLMRKG
jgi:opacity protein-like surface antigen